MASKIYIELTGIGELDISKEFPFPLQFSIDDVRNPEKRNTSYSKTLTLPGTKNNNYQFGSLFDVNSTFDFFNPNIKVKAKIIVDSSTVLDGFLQLKNIKKLNNTDLQGNLVQYEVVIFDNTADLFSDIGDKELTDLDFSDYDHIYGRDTIVASWSNTADDIYGYPILYKNSEKYETEDFKPGIFHKAYIRKIFEDAGFSVSGSFLEKDYYNREIIPFNGEIPVLTQTELDRRKFIAGPSSSSTSVKSFVHTGGLSNGRFSYSDQAFTFFDDDTTPPYEDDNNHWNTTLNKWTVDRNGAYNFEGEIHFEVDFNTNFSYTSVASGGFGKTIVTSVNHGLTTGTDIVLDNSTNASYDGTYIITNITTNTFEISKTYVGASSGDLNIEAWQYVYRVGQRMVGFSTNIYEKNIDDNGKAFIAVEIIMYKNGVEVQKFGNKDIQIPRTLGTSATFDASNNYQDIKTYKLSINKPNMSLLIGDEITFEYSFNGGALSSANARNLFKYNAESNSPKSNKNVPVNISLNILKDFNGTVVSNFRNDALSSSVTDGDPISLNNYIPKDIKQKDLLVDLIKRYNLYVKTDAENPKRIILETRDDYYDAGTVLDYTYKKDYSNEDKIELLSELQDKEMKFTYSPDGDDDWNKSYSESIDGQIYGQKEIIFDNEFTKSIRTVQTPVSPTVLVDSSVNRVMVVSSIDTEAPKTNIRVLYYSGLINTSQDVQNNFWEFTTVDSGVTTTTQHTTYPYAGHLDEPYSGGTIDLNYGELPYLMYDGPNQITNNNLYNRFWKNYISQIAEGRLVTSKFYLTDVDISFLRNNLNTKLFVKDSYYFINKIIDYNPVDNELTKVELLKIIDGVSFESQNETPEKKFTGFEISNVLGRVVHGNSRRSGGIQTGYRKKNTAITEHTFINGVGNTVGTRSKSALINGDDNNIGDDVLNSGVLGGDGNTIPPGTVNSWIIGTNDKTITEDNEIWVGDLHIKNGIIVNAYNLIEAGEDELTNIFPTNLIQICDGAEDTLRAININNVENLVDGGADKL